MSGHIVWLSHCPVLGMVEGIQCKALLATENFLSLLLVSVSFKMLLSRLHWMDSDYLPLVVLVVLRVVVVNLLRFYTDCVLSSPTSGLINDPYLSVLRLVWWLACNGGGVTVNDAQSTL